MQVGLEGWGAGLGARMQYGCNLQVAILNVESDIVCAPTSRERLPQLRASSETMVHTLARTRPRRGRRRKRSPPGWDRRVDVVGVVGVGGDVVE